MPVQDDARENQMIQLFNLSVPEGRSRADVDAQLIIDGRTLNFELKSTTSDSVSTVRDFGPDHIKKWRNDLHWIFAFYQKDGLKLRYCLYASPEDMERWIAEKEAYIRPDLLLANSLPALVADSMVIEALGEKQVYSQQDARLILKNQWNVAQYLEFQDVKEGYSLSRMTELFQQRSRYLILRGSTLNNPHIEGSYFGSFDHIVDEHASRLRELVRAYLSNASATDDATA